MFRKILIANRGEIAVRLTQAIQELGMQAVAIYSDPDAWSRHVEIADEAWPLGGTSPGESYLNTDKILTIAREAQVDAIHPGYGFLSENAGFAQACAAAGLTFIGPDPKVIEAMGDKIRAKEAMMATGVPVVPGWNGDHADIVALERAAHAIGFPILVKAAAGGGGKGMRLVETPEDLSQAVAAAAREAEKAFGDARIFLEKYITRPRHVEFQIFGDAHGHTVHLFERDCSIQRRHQKIVEESPSPALDPDLRTRMGQAAVEAARAIGYTNAGTVEFILDEDNQFYFLEVNTRLQVEHPVTEWVTRQDLVHAQIAVAMGKPLPWSQADLTQTGHALECRIYAEDPANHFLPATGTLHVYEEPKGPGIRVDSGVRQGQTVSVHYDPMLAKLTTWAATRTEAIAKMRWALAHYPVLGVTTNIPFLAAILAHPEFQAGHVDTHFLTRHAITAPPAESQTTSMAAILAAISQQVSRQPAMSPMAEGVVTPGSPWQTAGAWRGV